MIDSGTPITNRRHDSGSINLSTKAASTANRPQRLETHKSYITLPEDREQIGLRKLRKLREIAGEQADKLLGDWDKVAPDLRRHIVEFVAGDILSRPAIH
jgi:hypothetical protein